MKTYLKLTAVVGAASFLVISCGSDVSHTSETTREYHDPYTGTSTSTHETTTVTEDD